MRVNVKAPVRTVTVTLVDMTRDDVRALVQVLDADRDHPARAALYDELLRSLRMLPEDASGVLFQDE